MTEKIKEKKPDTENIKDTEVAEKADGADKPEKADDATNMDKAEKADNADDGLEIINIEDIGKKKKRKTTTFDYIRYAIMVVASIVFVVAGYELYSIFHEYSKGEKTYEKVVDSYVRTDEATGEAVAVTGVVVNVEFAKVNVDFEKLQSENPDVKAWIQFEGINEISYPVLKHPTDNNFYLKRMYNKEENTAGSIFLDIANSEYFKDYNTFVYGHNMKNQSMFGRLKEYKDAAFYAGKEYFWIYTPNANYQYQIFSIHEQKVDTGFFKTFESKGEEYTTYVEDCKKASRYDTGVEVTGDDRIITLSTCTARGDDWRLLVQAKLVGVETLTMTDYLEEMYKEEEEVYIPINENSTVSVGTLTEVQ